MTYVPILTGNFAGAGTSPGATFNGFVQRDNGTAYLKLDGSGNVSLNSADFNCIAAKPITGSAGYRDGRARIRFVWPSGTDTNTIFRVFGRYDPTSATIGNVFRGYSAILRGNGQVQVWVDAAGVDVVSFAPTTGHAYDLYLYWSASGSSTTLTAAIVDVTADPTTVAAQTAGYADNTAALNDQSKIYSAGISCDGSAFVPSTASNWKVSAFEVDNDVAPDFPGTTILDIANDAQALSSRVHRLSGLTENQIELWYRRDSLWRLFPIQPLSGPAQGLALTQTYRQPSTLEFTLPDPQGWYSSDSYDSPWNYKGDGTFDPLIDEARKIRLRVGTRCYGNLAAGILPTASVPSDAPSVMYVLTDGVLGDITNSIGDYESWTTADATPFTIDVDLGGSKHLRHAVIRFATDLLTATCTLPASVQFSFSDNGAEWRALPARPVGGPLGDWGDSPVGQTIEFAFCDIDYHARYVRFTVTPTGAQTILIDEMAVYGGAYAGFLGGNLFTGYLGDAIDFTSDGAYKLVATDVLKRLADNNDNFLTAAYHMTTRGWELADIAYSLLTATAYWRADTDYNSPWSADEIGWTNGSGLTGLQYPLWQGQTNNMLGYEYELWNTIGWNFYADGDGVLQATNPPNAQKLPDRVCIAGADGNSDVSNCKRTRTGKQMRNRVIVQTGKSASSGSGFIALEDPDSVARYGTRTTRITDPLASTGPIRQRVADYFLRDYAWNVEALSNTIRPQFETKMKQVFGFRASARPNLSPRASTEPGVPRNGRLWSLVGLRHNITYGKWEADADWIPYVPAGPSPPVFDSFNSVGGHTDWMAFTYDPITDLGIARMNVYVSVVGEFSGFVLKTSFHDMSLGNFSLTGFSPGVLTWAYLTTVDIYGAESIPSAKLSAIPGSTGQSIGCYVIDDFAVSSLLTEGPDSQGFYTFQVYATWNAPACGFTQDHIRGYVEPTPGSGPPSNPDDLNSWPVHDDSFNWWGPNRIPEGCTWDGVTPGILDFVLTFRSSVNLSGKKMWWRIWNSARTRAWLPIPGNEAFCVML